MSHRTLVISLALFAAGCAPGGDRPVPDTQRAAVPMTPPVEAAPATAQEVYIDSVSGTNPLVVTGRARTFENTVQLRARDATGDVITETFETSVGEIGHHNPYVGQLWLVRDPGASVTVEAFEYSAKDGSVRSLTSRSVPAAGPRMEVTLMLPTSDCTTTTAFTRQVPRTVSVARLLAEMLIAGPTPSEKSAGATAPFPAGSRVRSVVIREGVATVDFDERLRNVGGACAARSIRASVEETLSRLPGVRGVVITAAGSRELALQP